MRVYYGAKRTLVGAPNAQDRYWEYSLCLAPYFEEYLGGGKELSAASADCLLFSEVGSADEQVPGRHRVKDDHPHITGFDRCYIKRWRDGGAAWYVSREEAP